MEVKWHLQPSGLLSNGRGGPVQNQELETQSSSLTLASRTQILEALLTVPQGVYQKNAVNGGRPGLEPQQYGRYVSQPSNHVFINVPKALAGFINLKDETILSIISCSMIRLPDDVPGKAVKDCPDPWTTATHMSNLEKVPDCFYLAQWYMIN